MLGAPLHRPSPHPSWSQKLSQYCSVAKSWIRTWYLWKFALDFYGLRIFDKRFCDLKFVTHSQQWAVLRRTCNVFFKHFLCNFLLFSLILFQLLPEFKPVPLFPDFLFCCTFLGGLYPLQHCWLFNFILVVLNLWGSDCSRHCHCMRFFTNSIISGNFFEKANL